MPNNAGRSFNSNTDRHEQRWHPAVSDQQYFDSAFFGANFTNANSQGVFPTFSSGVIGTTFLSRPA